MKRNFFSLLAVLLLTLILVSISHPVLASNVFQEIQDNFAPSTISYQGMVKVDGQPYSGTGYFKFVITNADGSVSYWSNDGTSTEGRAPNSSVALPVTDGLFSVLLGDTSLSGMTQPITASTLWRSGNNLRLRVFFSASATGFFVQLSPDRKLSSVPFALVAEYTYNSNMVDGKHAADFASAIHNHDDLYQAILSGGCLAGSAVQSVNADGTLNCQTTHPNEGRLINGVDSDGDVGLYSSMAIGEDGFPIISYYDASDFNLKVAHCNDPYCEDVTITVLDSTFSVGTYTAITINGIGYAQISYRDNTNQDLKIASCLNIACTEFNIKAVTSADNIGEYTSISPTSGGYVIVSFFDSVENDLKFARCTDYQCGSVAVGYLDSSTTTIFRGPTSITLTPGGNPIVAYRDGAAYLRVAYCVSSDCSLVNNYLVDNSTTVGNYLSMTIGSDGFGIISYYDVTNQDLKVAHCLDKECSTSEKFTIDTEGDAGKHNSIITGRDGLAVIAYHRDLPVASGYKIAVAHCSNIRCDSASISEIQNMNYPIGLYTSIAIGMDGLPIISYYNDPLDGDGHLTAAHCANPLCGSYRRGR